MIKMLHILVSENNFNSEAVGIIQNIKMNSECYLERLEVLKPFYDSQQYKVVESILTKINNFSNHYLEDERVSSIEKKDLSKKETINKQNNNFILEEVQHYLEGNNIEKEIIKIRDAYHNDLINLVNSLYDFEKKSYRVLDDIIKEIGYEEKISISEILWSLT
jgi:hypothetical protein